MTVKSICRRIGVGIAAASLAVAVGAGDASAATKVSWVGPTPPGQGGQIYLTTSTINNAPLEASSRIYTSFGNSVAAGQIGVQARLFKSGVLCQITPYIYNPFPANTLTTNTYGDCGTGSYNSHGFVKYWTGTAYGDFLTFPTDPLNYTAPAARTAPTTTPVLSTTTNNRGQTAGSAESARTPDEQPDLIAAYGTNGEFGYVKKDDLAGDLPSQPSEATTHTDPAPRTIPLYALDGTTPVGSFTLK